MEQRMSLITLGVNDLARARRFYEEGLGWKVGLAEGEIVFLQLNGLILSLYPRAALAKDAGVVEPGGGFGGITLAHNVRSEPEVDTLLSVSLVAECDGEVVGHVAASPVTLSEGTTEWFGLGPVSVLPAWQGRGIGSALMEACLSRLRERGARGCLLVGEPGYYQRFGFRHLPELILPGVPPEYFMALNWSDDRPQGEVDFHPAFEATA